MSLEETEVSPAGGTAPRLPPRKPPVVPILVGLVVAVIAAGASLYRHAMASTNTVALASSPKGVTTVEARGTTYRATRRYVGTVQPWVEARVGPQMVSAYVDTVLVRPGMAVKRGEVIATLDCRNASATDRAVQMQARAMAATQAALASQAARVSSLLDGGFISPNEVEQKTAESASKQAQMLALQAQAAGSALQISDCVLRAPFDGEVSARHVDPGAFVRPGSPIATLVDRRTVRVVADVPEQDFSAVVPGAPVKVRYLATGTIGTARISRRAPSADPMTRTAHIEIDIEDAARALPVGTTAELGLEVGDAVPATVVPLSAASVKGNKASLFVVSAGKAQAVRAKLLGELEGRLYLDGAVPAGAHVVTEGRGALVDQDPVTERLVKEELGTEPSSEPVHSQAASSEGRISGKGAL